MTGSTSSNRTDGSNPPRLYLWFAIALIAALLQFWDLGDKSLWHDEIVTVRIAEAPSLQEFQETFQQSERQPPLHHLLLHVWIKVFGSGVTSVRFPSAMLAMGSAVLLVAFGVVLGRPRVGLIAGALLAINPLLVLLGRMARYYSLALFLGLLSALCLVIATKREEAGRAPIGWWLLYSVSAAAGVLTNYTSLAFLGAEVIYLLIWAGVRARVAGGWKSLRGVFGRLLAAHILLLVPLGLWVAYDWQRITGFGRSFREFDLSGWKALVLNSTYPFYAFGLGETIFPWEPAAIGGAVVIAVLGLFGIWRIKRFEVFAPLVVLGLFATLGITIVAFQFFVRDLPFVTLPARAIGALPFFLLIVASGADVLPRRIVYPVLFLLATVNLASVVNYFTETSFHNSIYAVPAREIASFIEGEAEPGSAIVADHDSGIDHYLRASRDSGTTILSAQEEGSLTKLKSTSYPEVWLITLGRDGSRTKAPSAILDWVSANYRLELTRGYVPQDPTYSRVKEEIQGFADYDFKITVQVYRSEGLRDSGQP